MADAEAGRYKAVSLATVRTDGSIGTAWSDGETPVVIGAVALLHKRLVRRERGGGGGVEHLFIATADDDGQDGPGAFVPHGLATVTPLTDPRTHTGYNYNSTKIAGFTGITLEAWSSNNRTGRLGLIAFDQSNNQIQAARVGSQVAAGGTYTIGSAWAWTRIGGATTITLAKGVDMNQLALGLAVSF